MGVLYRIRCKECAGKFVHNVGGPMFGGCLRCERADQNEDKFSCPICRAQLNPQSEEFMQQVESVEYWD